MQTALSHAVERLDAILTQETDALRGGRVVDLTETAGRKNQSLLELTRLTRGLRPELLSEASQERLRVLKQKLNENGRVLQLHLKASHDISAIISKSIAAADSDGTYDEHTGHKGSAR